MRYLKGSVNKKITLGRMIQDSAKLGTSGYELLNDSNCKGDKNKVLLGFCDADHAGCRDGRRSTSGYVFFFNGPVSWASKLQHTVALAPCEAEYMSMGTAASESRWIFQLLQEISEDLCEDVIIFEDNTSAIALAMNNKITARSKHIDIRHHFIQQYIREGKLKVFHARSKLMCADALTKHLGPNLACQHNKTMLG
jgi:hypothetical protein